jgi:hypothetical protein
MVYVILVKMYWFMALDFYLKDMALEMTGWQWHGWWVVDNGITTESQIWTLTQIHYWILVHNNYFIFFGSAQ